MASTKASDSRQPAPDGLTRSQVARQLGIGITAVHHMRLRGELRPTRDASGTWRYDPADVIRAAAKRGVRGLHTAGDVAAEAFNMFEQGGELRDVVKALRITPAEARRLYQDWQSSFDDPPPVRESAGLGLLDEDPRAEEEFARAMAQSADHAFAPLHKPKK